MFVSLSAALVQACGFGQKRERRTALWQCRGMERETKKRRKGRWVAAYEAINKDEVKSSGHRRGAYIIASSKE